MKIKNAVSIITPCIFLALSSIYFYQPTFPLDNLLTTHICITQVVRDEVGGLAGAVQQKTSL